MPEQSINNLEPTKQRRLHRIRKVVEKLAKGSKAEAFSESRLMERRQQQMFTKEERDYAQKNPASQGKIDELLTIVKTLAAEKKSFMERAGIQGGVFPITEEGKKHPNQAPIVYYHRSGTLAQAASNQASGEPVAEVTHIDEKTVALAPGTVEGFGWPDQDTYVFVHNALFIYDTNNPSEPLKVLRKRVVETIEARVFSELLPDQSRAEAEIPSTDRDIDYVIDVLTKAAQSNPPQKDGL